MFHYMDVQKIPGFFFLAGGVEGLVTTSRIKAAFPFIEAKKEVISEKLIMDLALEIVLCWDVSEHPHLSSLF